MAGFVRVGMARKGGRARVNGAYGGRRKPRAAAGATGRGSADTANAGESNEPW
ncbi:MAG: hypothetical protein U0746_17105 [Gemmataceae bacterium]